ncbi:hypothetical protein ACFUIS_26995, partial [Streptomyces sp. NPDC057266]
MFGRWKARRGAGGDTSGASAPTPSQPGPGDAWAALPPLQRALPPARPVADPSFAASLATHSDPSFQRALGHGSVVSAPGGLLLDAVRVLPDRPSGAPLPAMRLPVAAGPDGTVLPDTGTEPAPASGLPRAAAPQVGGTPGPTARPAAGAALP